MKKYLIPLAQIVIFLIGACVLLFLLTEPLFEGRNVHASLTQVYFTDLFLTLVYLGSLPFFKIIQQAHIILKKYSQEGTPRVDDIQNNLNIIRRCAGISIGFVILGEVYIAFQESDDRVGGIFMGGIAILFFIIVMLLSVFFEKLLRQKSE